MRAVLFIVYLCALFVNAKAHAFAGTDTDAAAHFLSHPATRQALVVSGVGDLVSVDAQESGREKPYLFCDDAEEEDADDNLTQKVKPVGDITPFVCYQSILRYHYNCYKPLPTFVAITLRRYVLHGVLRI